MTFRGRFREAKDYFIPHQLSVLHLIEMTPMSPNPLTTHSRRDGSKDRYEPYQRLSCSVK